MNAHDQLERQLRASVARGAEHGAARRPRGGSWSSGLSLIVLAVSTAVAVGVAVFALVVLHHRRPPSSRPAAPGLGHAHRRRSALGPRPKNPGPIPRNVEDRVIAAASRTAWGKDPSCGPRVQGPLGSTVSYGRPSAAMLSTVPALGGWASPADQLPSDLYGPGGRLPAFEPAGKVYIRFVRRARVAYGITFYLVPAGDLGRSPLSVAAATHCYRLTVAALQAKLPTVPPSQRAATRRYGDAEFAVARYNLETSHVYEGLFLVAKRSEGVSADGGQSPSTIRQSGMLGGGGGGKRSRTIVIGGRVLRLRSTIPSVMDGIVPAGVASVTLRFPASSYRGRRLPALSATGHVVNDVFVIPIPTLLERDWPNNEVWRTASGRVIKIVNERPFHP